jgi:hypothetical protein
MPWEKKRYPSEGSVLNAGNIMELATTNQTYRGRGWVFHVSVDGRNGGDEVYSYGGFDTETAAINAAEDWLRQLCSTALASIAPAQAEQS